MLNRQKVHKLKKVSKMTRKCHNRILQTNPWHGDKSKNLHNKSKATSSLFPSEMIAKLEKTVKQNKTKTNNANLKGGGSVVVDFLFIVTPIVGVCNCSMFCCMLLYVHSSIAIILMGKGELVALLNLSSWCLVMVERLFLAVPRGCLRFVIVVFPDHTHLLFLRTTNNE